MNIKLGRTIEAKDPQTSIKEGKVVAIGSNVVIVRVTKLHRENMDKRNIGDLYEIRADWIESESAFYQVKIVFFKVGLEYVYRDSWMPKVTYKILDTVTVTDPIIPDEPHHAVAVVTNSAGKKYVEVLDQHDFDMMVEA